MNTPYYDAVDRMQRKGVDPDYLNGWVCGYLHSPMREEQRRTEAYEAGYAHGLEKNAAGFDAWVAK